MGLQETMLSTRLARSSCGPLLRVPTSTLSPLQTMATMKPISQSEHLTGREFWSKNKALNRPISPHLTIYKFQLTSMLSITHRGTGLAQSGMLTGVGLGALMLPGIFPGTWAMGLRYLNCTRLAGLWLACQW